MQTQTLLALLALLALVNCYGTTITRSAATTSSITDFYQDFSYCACDTTPSLCDNYCCCDASCASVLVGSTIGHHECLGCFL